MIDKEDILGFLEWADNNRAASLCHDTGYGEPCRFTTWDLNDIIDDYIKSQEGE